MACHRQCHSACHTRRAGHWRAIVNLKDWRAREGLSQQEAANTCGVTRTAFANYEGGARQIPPAILNITGCDQNPIIEVEEEAPPPPWLEEEAPRPVRVAPVAPKPVVRRGDIAAPIRIVGQTPRGLNIGEDGRLYGEFERVSDQPKLAALLKGTGAKWTERFPSANGLGVGSSIIWSVLKGETEADCAPVLAGRHYSPARGSVERAGSRPKKSV